MTTIAMKPRVTSFAPQFLVDDLERSITYYNKLGFAFGEPWDGFYAIGELNGLELHLKEAPKNQVERRWRRDNEHLDASAGVDGVFAERLGAHGESRPYSALSAVIGSIAAAHCSSPKISNIRTSQTRLRSWRAVAGILPKNSSDIMFGGCKG